MKYVPENGYGQVDGGADRLHAWRRARRRARHIRDLAEATRRCSARSLAAIPICAGPARRARSRSRSGGRWPCRSSIGRISAASERIGLYTTFLADGNLFYYATIVPDQEADALPSGVRSDWALDPAPRRAVGSSSIAPAPRHFTARASPCRCISSTQASTSSFMKAASVFGSSLSLTAAHSSVSLGTLKISVSTVTTVS